MKSKNESFFDWKLAHLLSAYRHLEVVNEQLLYVFPDTPFEQELIDSFNLMFSDLNIKFRNVLPKDLFKKPSKRRASK